MKSTPRRLATAGVCFAGFALIPGHAQELSGADLARCAAIPTDGDRLACYDRLARSHATAAPASVAQPPEKPDQSFGITKPIKPAGPSRIEAKVLGMATDSAGGALVKLDNDQTWAIDDGPAILRAGDAIVIKRAALGSFLMSTPTGRIFRVRRLQ